jgi:hypothetical protein
MVHAGGKRKQEVAREEETEIRRDWGKEEERGSSGVY